jgi:hypothetical protein
MGYSPPLGYPVRDRQRCGRFRRERGRESASIPAGGFKELADAGLETEPGGRALTARLIVDNRDRLDLDHRVGIG